MFLTNFEKSEQQFDPRWALLAAVVQQHHGKGPMTPVGWVPLLEAVLDDRFRDGRGNVKSARAKASVVGGLFTDYLDARFEVDGAGVRGCARLPGRHGVKGRPTCLSPAHAIKVVER